MSTQTQSGVTQVCVSLCQANREQIGPQTVWRAVLVGRPPSARSHPARLLTQKERNHSRTRPQVLGRGGAPFSPSLIGRSLARHLCPSLDPHPLLPLPIPIPIPTLPESHNRYRDPRWKSNSINQIIARHSAGIPTSRLHANEAGRGCGEGKVCVCVLLKGEVGRRGAARQRPVCCAAHRSALLSASRVSIHNFKKRWSMLPVNSSLHLFFSSLTHICTRANQVFPRLLFLTTAGPAR